MCTQLYTCVYTLVYSRVHYFALGIPTIGLSLVPFSGYPLSTTRGMAKPPLDKKEHPREPKRRKYEGGGSYIRPEHTALCQTHSLYNSYLCVRT